MKDKPRKPGSGRKPSTHCKKKGHTLTADNLYVEWRGEQAIQRCRTCKLDYETARQNSLRLLRARVAELEARLKERTT